MYFGSSSKSFKPCVDTSVHAKNLVYKITVQMKPKPMTMAAPLDKDNGNGGTPFYTATAAIPWTYRVAKLSQKSRQWTNHIDRNYQSGTDAMQCNSCITIIRLKLKIVPMCQKTTKLLWGFNHVRPATQPGQSRGGA